MGGDVGLPVTVPAALAFARRFPDTALLLVGRAAEIEQALSLESDVPRERIEIVSATEVVEMDDSVEIALRRKKDSSMRLAAQAVKDGRADACVSAGNTGAWMAISITGSSSCVPAWASAAFTASLPARWKATSEESLTWV